MPYSMTGMGKASKKGDSFSAEIELKSVNNRFLVIKSHLPDFLMEYDQNLQETIRKQVKRGTVDLRVNIKRGQDRTKTKGRINKNALNEYLDAIKKVRKAEGQNELLVPELILSLPGVVEIEEKEFVFKKKDYLVISEVLSKALDRLKKMRAAEGKRLIRNIKSRHRIIGRFLKTIEKNSGLNCAERKKKLKARLEKLLEGEALSSDDPALQREVAVLVDRLDITEEIDRLKCHLAEFTKIADSEDEIGRRLDFLLQEMGREINTIGSKSCSPAISHDVVQVKAELEKIREQVQNIE